jgi:hypothetical protein
LLRDLLKFRWGWGTFQKKRPRFHIFAFKKVKNMFSPKSQKKLLFGGAGVTMCYNATFPSRSTLHAHASMSPRSSATATVGLVLLALVATATAARTLHSDAVDPARNSVNLGTAGDFAILAKSGVSTVPDR